MPSARLLLAAGPAVVAIGAALLAGCGGGSGGEPAVRHGASRADGVARTEADPHGGLIFAPADLSARAGKVTVELRNPATSGVAHGIAVSGEGIDRIGAVVKPGQTSEVRARLKPGTYHLWCPAHGHAMAGMKGILRVK